MERDRKSRILDSAFQEFVNKGYEQASLRTICQNAGVTTGSLYRDFKNKEDLFRQIVMPVFVDLNQMLMKHLREESRMDVFEYEKEKDLSIIKQVVEYYYQHEEVMKLLLYQAKGTEFEHLKDDIVYMVEQENRHMINNLMQQSKSHEKNTISDEFFHWFAHTQIDAFIFAFEHCKDEETAMNQIESASNFIRSGFENMILKTIH